jgi:hypothetical protein
VNVRQVFGREATPQLLAIVDGLQRIVGSL